MPRKTSRWFLLIPLTAMTLAAGVLLHRLPTLPFMLDDARKIVGNPDIRDLSGILQRLIYPYAPGDNGYRNDPSRPLVSLAYTILFHYCGLNPAPYHFLNLLVHLLNGALLFTLVWTCARRMRSQGAVIAALIAGAFFLLTPINTGSAAYVYALSDLLATTALLFALLGWMSLRLTPRQRSLWAACWFCVGLFAKQSLLVLPLILAAASWAFPPPSAHGKRAGAYALLPSTGFAAGYLCWRWWTFGAIGDVEGGSYVKSLAEYLPVQPWAIWRYLQMLLIPWGLAVDHDPEPAILHPLLYGGAALLLLLTLVASALAAWRWRRFAGLRLATLGALTFFLLLAPTSLLPTVDLMVERRAYTASLGVALAIAAGAMALAGLGRRVRLLVGLAAGGALGILATLSVLRIELMRSPTAPWEESLRLYPVNFRAHLQLGSWYLRQGRYREAGPYYEELLRLYPEETVARSNFAVLLSNPASPYWNPARAAAMLDEIIAAHPDDASAIQNRGVLEYRLNHPAQAMPYFERALALSPRNYQVHNNLASAALALGDKARARRHLSAALALMPDDPLVRENLTKLDAP